MFCEDGDSREECLTESVFSFVKNATKVVLWIALFLMILQTLGVSTASLITILGASGAAVALALQGSLSNVAGGIITIIKQPFKTGDEIEIKGTVCISGIVDAVYLMNMELHTWDNKTVSVRRQIGRASCRERV